MSEGNNIRKEFMESFLKFNESEALFEAGKDKILVAVSGGVDSVILAYMLNDAAAEIGIAHCNFHLRGEESDGDEKFTEELASKLGCKYFVKHFNTIEYADKEGISIEMAARDLRYAWFDELAEEQGYKYIATGHHLDDQIETFFINLARGTGISGLRGIPSKNKNIIRPLLFAHRSKIEEVAAENLIAHRYDSSNDSMSFKRNQVRHKLLPLLEELNPSFRHQMAQNISNLKDTEKLYNEHIQQKAKRIIKEEDGIIKIDIKGLKKLDPVKTYLFEILAPYNFNISVTEDILNSLDDISGKQFFSGSHRLVKDRDELLITLQKTPEESEWQYLVNENDTKAAEPLQLQIKRLEGSYAFKADNNIAAIDADLLKFPLSIRKWEMGDFFYPLGMTNKKKLSDFFSDNKFSLVDKENSWVLVSGDDIVWLMGHRIDNRYKLTESTKNILEIRIVTE